MEKIDEILCNVFRLKEDELNDELTMSDIEKWDSLTHMDLVISLEEGLDIQLTMDDIMSMKDVKTIKSIVQERLI
ncbi:acyl carrier protein [Sulfurimonas sp.]|jgi:acyl carrier protein|uniref:acyl carrier protein n=1 Tax=Sulfurimonas sp. TaxID=2022749 RepID=UPI0025F71648|nr:acyl carrier protein [Sulfurimonas sp.]MCK9472188.1 acyl carrier protein [Sulfurimonas sp.]MDD3505896.1 acyl carrier protein [Sulfurimonas sp.]